MSKTPGKVSRPYEGIRYSADKQIVVLDIGAAYTKYYQFINNYLKLKINTFSILIVTNIITDLVMLVKPHPEE